MRVALRADEASGTGHVVRCNSLAAALQERGAETRFVDDAAPADWLVVDHYGVEPAWETQARRQAPKILAIDDFGSRRHDCDILVDQNFNPDADARYAALLPARCRRLLGPRYAILRSEFRKIKAHVRKGTVRHVLVSLGGEDPGNETANAVKLLKGRGLEVDVVVGAANRHHEEVARLCRDAGFRFHRQASNMAELMAAADLAVGAGGTTTWERCRMGLPTVQLSLAGNQVGPSRALAEAGLVIYAGASLTEEPLLRAIGNPGMLKKQSRRLLELVDGQGARRVAAALFASASTNLSLRQAKPGDARLYFDWANDPEVRRQSFDSRPIAWPEHEAWFARRLEEGTKQDALLLVAEDEAGIPAGQVRFERKDAWRVNYALAAEFRGVGLGAKMLGMAIDQLRRRDPGARLQAEVKPDNVPSRRIFEALGFRAASPTLFERNA